VGIRYFTRYSNSGNVFVKVENKEFSSQGWNFEDEGWTDFKRSSIPVSIFTHGFVDSYIVNVLIRLKRTNEVYRSWQLDTYNAIIEAYKRQLSEYRRKLDELKDNAKLYGNNPTKNRIIEQQELKKGAIAVLNDNGHYFNNFHETYKSSGYPVINVYALNQPAEKVNFFEQSIDWDLMSYKFYPYFWQTDNSPMTATTGRWSKVYSIRDNDDTFEKFLQAGYAQVIVPVKPGCELQVLNFLEYGVMLNQNFVSKVPVVDLAKKEFLATKTPTFSSPRQVEKWFTKAPTNLVILQTSAQGAPGVGLPCWESNDKRLNPDLITLDEQFGT
jgi:hypothetical protein